MDIYPHRDTIVSKNNSSPISTCLAINRLINFNETLLDVKIGKESVTWGDLYDDLTKITCLKYGFIKRQSEQSVLPHAIGCKPPSENWEYISVLRGLC